MKVENNQDEFKRKRDELTTALSGLEEASRKNYVEKLEKQAELFLQEQLKAALAITQRAITLAAIFGAVIASIIGITGTLISKDVSANSFFCAIVPLAIALLISLSKSVLAAKPARFYYAGSNPVHWLDDIKGEKEFILAQAEQVGLYCQSIVDNNANLKQSQDRVDSALNWAGVGLALFALIEFIFVLSAIGKNGFPSLF